MEETKTHRVRVIHLATAGLIVESEGTRVMVDGLFGTKGHSFSVVPRPLHADMVAGKEPFGPVQHLMFTHLHPDHFDCEETIAYLERNPVKSVLLPVDAASEKRRLSGERLRAWMDAHGVAYRLLDLPAGRSAGFAFDGLRVTAFNTMHMGPQYGIVSNYCLLLHLGGRTLLITGDADFDKDAFAGALNGMEPDAAFVNPLFFQDPRGREILDSVVRPPKVILYHIPFAEDDTMKLRAMVKWQMKKYKGVAYEVLALTEPNQRLSL